jgi:hypothetical protein
VPRPVNAYPDAIASGFSLIQSMAAMSPSTSADAVAETVPAVAWPAANRSSKFPSSVKPATVPVLSKVCSESGARPGRPPLIAGVGDLAAYLHPYSSGPHILASGRHILADLHLYVVECPSAGNSGDFLAPELVARLASQCLLPRLHISGNFETDRPRDLLLEALDFIRNKDSCPKTAGKTDEKPYSG